ncbi:pantothenate kinase, putative [Plasmodium berghei]|uniref:Pantothenate kinase 2, putative n=2 Tax=Plasmodium berghei TaxID=5821 RepID=A0A509AJK3_PLABA|nr:pantothenate kinase 2, putative [Plasmodium berghei ANKA]CXI17891.1 pantothenate kinase, putative [Plasmodium berghei]SCM19734.1 pantothenate kinase, putative [Plasmodium berghei]SCN23468.1 pantothenate kinase, putative [Plasmodium berghei]SCO59101.1 pantothenate kinase, putative [Plasmodium berghei]SCO59776.1 pantothenate kinase, putative [Plasmodium berghei]|eukprot:XP_034420614.1 pantothenate kinase 2, putative [Plasmodium berghei ANKA]
MGNIIGVECSFNRVHIIIVVLNEKIKSKCSNKLNNNIVGNIYNCFPVCYNNNYKINQNCNYISPICESGKETDSNLPSENYMTKKKDILEYILNIQHIIKNNVQLMILNKNFRKNKDAEFSLNELTQHFNGNSENIDEKFHIYNNFLKKKLNINEDEVGEEIATFYFLTVKVKHIDEAILKYSERAINKTQINLTGKRSNYIMKKLIKMRGIMKNIYFHKEITCINNCITFLKNIYPQSLYHFVMEKSDFEKKYEQTGNNEENKQLDLKKTYIENNDSIKCAYPYIIVTMKRAISYHLVNEKNEIYQIGNCFIGYKSVISLFLLITGKLCSMEKLFKIAKKGTNKTFDMSVGDIYGTSYCNAGLSSDLTASCFGGVINIDNIKDIFVNHNKQTSDVIKNEVDIFSSSSEYDISEEYSTDEMNTYYDIDIIPTLTKSNYNNNEKWIANKKCLNNHTPKCKYFFKQKYLSDDETSIKKYIKKKSRKQLGEKWNSLTDHELYIRKNYKENYYSLSDEDLNCELLKNKKKIQKYYEQVRKKKNSKMKNMYAQENYVNRKTVQMEYNNIENKKVNIISEKNLENMDDPLHNNNTNKNATKYYSNIECDLSRTLLSMTIYNATQMGYIHSHVYNVKHIFFSGFFLENSTCIELLKTYIKFMYHNEQTLYFFKYSTYISSLGAALQLLDWEYIF